MKWCRIIHRGGEGWVGGLLPYKSERDAHQKIKIKLLLVVVVFFFLLVSHDSYVLVFYS